MYTQKRLFHFSRFSALFLAAATFMACGRTNFLFQGNGSTPTPEASSSAPVAANAVNPPVILGISPSLGSLNGGTQLMLVGTGFTAGTNSIWLGGSPCTNVNFVSSTLLTCVTGPGTSGTKTVVLSDNVGQVAYYPELTQSYANGFSYTADPPILIGSTGRCIANGAPQDRSTICPMIGFTGESTQVTIVGNNFKQGAIVTIGGQICCKDNLAIGDTCTNIYPTVDDTLIPHTISCYAPPNPIFGGAIVSVINPDQQSVVSSDTPFYYGDPINLSYPSTSITPTTGNAITALTPTIQATAANPPSYFVSPPLPAGISLNSATGVISGTPTATTDSILYTITAVNAKGGSTSTTIRIDVN